MQEKPPLDDFQTQVLTELRSISTWLSPLRLRWTS